MFFSVIASLVITIISFVIYRHFTYWSRRGIKGPTFLNSLSAFKAPLHIYDDLNYKKYGLIFGIPEITRHNLFINDPELIKEIMIKQFHNFPDHRHVHSGSTDVRFNLFNLNEYNGWKRVRSILSPSFTSGKLRYMMSSMNDLAEDFVTNLATVANKDESINIKKYIGAFTMDVISNCAFGINPRTLQNPNHPIVVNAKKILNVDASIPLILSLIAPSLAKLLKFEPFSFESGKFFETLVRQIVDERKKEIASNIKRNDFLQLVIDANLKDNNNSVNNNNEINDVKGTLSVEELIGQGVIFFLAGYDTTGSTLSHCVYYLAQNIEYQEMLLKELESLDELTNDSLANLKFLNAVIMETLRIAPPLLRIERTCVADCYLGDLFVAKGTIITTLPYSVQHDPNNFEDPEAFKPERFMGEESHNPYTYFPFGGGPRLCLGQRFAMNEMRMFLAKLIPKFTFHSVPNSKIEYAAGNILLSPKEIKVSLKKRK